MKRLEKVSLKKLIYFGIILVSLSLISISVLLFNSTSTIKSTQNILEQIIKIETKKQEILKYMNLLNTNEIKLLISKDENDLNNLEGGLINGLDNFEEIKFNDFRNYEIEYNNLVLKLKDGLLGQIVIQNNFYTNLFSTFILKEKMHVNVKKFKTKVKEILNTLNQLSAVDNIHFLKLVNIISKYELEIKDLSYLILENKIRQKDKILKEIEKNIFDEIKKLNILSKNEKDLYSKINTLNTYKKEITKTSYKISKNKDFLIESEKKQKELSSLIIINISKIEKIQLRINEEYLSSSKEKNKLMKISNVLIVLFSIICLLIFSFILIKRVTAPLNKIILKMKEILHNDDKLNTIINHNYDDEYKVLADTFNEMTKKLFFNIKSLKEKEYEIKQMNKNLELLVDVRTKELSVKSHKIASLLNNASQGFLSFSKEMLIDDEYSKQCERFLEKDLSNKNIIELLFSNEEKKDFYKSIIIDSFNENQDLVKSSYLSLLPKEIILNKRALLLEYKVLENNRLMLIITNISSKKKLEKKIKEEQERVRMIVSIISNQAQFFEILKNFEEFISELKQLKKENSDNKEVNSISYYYRQVHTFKGLFSQVYMQNLTQYLHTIEENISKLKSDDINGLRNTLNTDSLNEYLDLDLDLISDVLGKSFLEDKNIIKINEDSFKYLEQLVNTLYKSDDYNTIYKDLAIQIKRLKQQRFYDMFFSYEKLCFDLATSLNKNIIGIKMIGDINLFIPNELSSFSKSLVHVFRNIMDHAIEPYEERIELQKNKDAEIICSYEELEDEFIIKISDDGRGLDIDKLKEKAILLNIFTKKEIEKQCKEKIYELIFEDNFSTKNEINDLSGRGVGMAAVKAEIDEIKGSILIESEKNCGTTFIFKLPKESKK